MGYSKKPTKSSGIPRERLPIDLRIQGADIFLSGHFHRWQATVSMGPDLDELTVRMAVDATSPDQLTAEPAEKDLLSFRSVDVKRILPNTFRARGALTTITGTNPSEMLVEVPEGHNAILGLTFVARKDAFGPSWKELITATGGAGGIDAERLLDPRAGVRDPELAAA
jgi:hypothetical protein